MAVLNATLKQGIVAAGEVALHYVEAGEGPAAVLLHGFPEFWYSWRHQVPFLAERGFRVIAPDLRGYNQSSAPADVKSYRISCLVEDVAHLIDRLGVAPVALAGHDWGGVIAWRLAALHPHLVRALVILNAPHPLAFRRELKRSPGQWLRSLYAGFFQLPYLPESLLSARDFALLRRALRVSANRRDAFSDEDLEKYAEAFRASGLSAPLNYYRAAVRYGGDLTRGPHCVSSPTLVIWGERDPALSARLTDGLEVWAPGLRLVRLPEAGHFVQHDAPGKVNELLLEFVSGG